MPLPIFNTLAEVPEAFRGEYEEREGKAHPKPPAAGMTEADKAALQSVVDKERTAAAAEKKRADDAQRELDALKRTKEAKDKGISEEELQKIRDAEALARKPIEEERDKLARENRQLKLTDRVKALALANGVLQDRIAKVMKDLEGRVDLSTDGNSIVVKDAAGNITAETIENFLSKTYKEESPFFYAGTGGSGSGGTGSNGSGGEGDKATKLPPEREAAYRREIAGSF